MRRESILARGKGRNWVLGERGYTCPVPAERAFLTTRAKKKKNVDLRKRRRRPRRTGLTGEGLNEEYRGTQHQGGGGCALRQTEERRR